MLFTTIIKTTNKMRNTKQQHFHNIKTFSKLAYNITSKKFHELASKFDKNEIIHPLFEDNLITKYLNTNNDANNRNRDYLSKQSNNNNNNNNNKLSSTIHQPKLVNYTKILTNSPRGSILEKEYKNSELCMMGMNYTHTSYENIYKTLMKFQPDCILVQNRPELFCEGFVDIKKDENTNVFSDRLYVGQLDVVRNGKEIVGMVGNEEGKKLMEERIFPRRKIAANNNNKMNNKNILPSILEHELLQEKPLLTSIYHSLYSNSSSNNNNKSPLPIYLTQLPQHTSRQWLCNTNTLMQLQEIFKQVTKSLPLYPATNITPYQLACYMFPEQFLGVNDKYMATMIEVMLALGYKKVMMFCAVGENEAVWEILENSLHCDKEGNINPLIESLIPPQVKSSLIRNHDTLELIEKHILLDTLYYGSKLTTIPINKFTTTNKIINHYGKEEPKELLFKFRYEMCMKYSELLDECVREGEERKRKEFMRVVIRQ